MAWTAAELQGMKKRELIPICRELGVPCDKNHNAAECVRGILAAQAAQSLPSGTPTPGAPPLESTEAKPGFENLIRPVTFAPDGGGDPAATAWGGERPGAGRPVGTTADVAAVRSLPEVPNPAVQDALEMLFALWAAKVQCRDVCLTKAEAVRLALPWTQGLHLVGLNDHIPPSLRVVLSLVWTTADVVAAKAKYAREAVAARKAAVPVEAQAA